MTQPSSTYGKSPKDRNVWIVALSVGLAIGLGLGVAASVAYIVRGMKQEMILGFAINPVDVSGTAHISIARAIPFLP